MNSQPSNIFVTCLNSLGKNLVGSCVWKACQVVDCCMGWWAIKSLISFESTWIYLGDFLINLGDEAKTRKLISGEDQSGNNPAHKSNLEYEFSMNIGYAFYMN